MPSVEPSLARHFRAMARNNLWSNHRLHAACAQLAESEYHRDRGGFFGSIHRTLGHILVVDRHYLARLGGGGAEAAEGAPEVSPNLASLTREQETTDRQLIALCDGLGTAGLRRVARWTDTSGRAYADPVHVVLAHLFMHQIHHRGQVHDLLSHAGLVPPQLDEFFLSQDAPRREAELRRLGIAESE